MPPPSDADLVRRCIEGEDAAWAILVARYADVVFGIARRHGITAADAGDVVQEVFVSLLGSLRRLRRIDHLLAWIVRTAKREAWRQVRRARAGERRERTASRPEGVGEEGLETGLETLETHARVRLAYDAIGERCRRLLDALFISDVAVPYDAIARRLGLAVGSIGSIRQRCLAELRDELERLGFEGDVGRPRRTRKASR